MKLTSDDILTLLAAVLTIAGAIGQSGAIIATGITILVIVSATNRRVR
jgi:hypothetical protein